jgi:hypothetical protein
VAEGVDHHHRLFLPIPGLPAAGPNDSAAGGQESIAGLESRAAAALPEWPHSTEVQTLAHEITARGGEGSAAQVDTLDERAVAEYIASVASPPSWSSLAPW